MLFNPDRDATSSLPPRYANPSPPISSRNPSSPNSSRASNLPHTPPHTTGLLPVDASRHRAPQVSTTDATCAGRTGYRWPHRLPRAALHRPPMAAPASARCASPASIGHAGFCAPTQPPTDAICAAARRHGVAAVLLRPEEVPALRVHPPVRARKRSRLDKDATLLSLFSLVADASQCCGYYPFVPSSD